MLRYLSRERRDPEAVADQITRAILCEFAPDSGTLDSTVIVIVTAHFKQNRPSRSAVSGVIYSMYVKIMAIPA